MKNALDWLVGGLEFPCKPVMLINTPPRASHVQGALREVLSTMSGNVVEGACISISPLGSGLEVEGIFENKEMSGALIAGLNEFCMAIDTQKRNKRRH